MPQTSPSPRVAVAGFVHESNSFAPSPADMAAFHQGGGYLPLCRGDQIIRSAAGVNLPVAGLIAHAQDAGWQLLPVIWAGAVPSAPVTADCYRTISDEVVAGLRDLGPLDGVFLDLHGAMVAEGAPDGEGVLLERVRAAVGPNVPVVTALDLHGNISERMVRHADVMVGFCTYPHVDMAETGRRAGVQLGGLMSGEVAFKAFRQADFLIPIAWQATSTLPARDLYAMIDEAEADGVCASLFMGFPAADFVDCRPSIIAYAGSQAQADQVVDRISAALSAAEDAFRGECFTPQDGVRAAAEQAQGPVILVDTQDNPGAGGNSDTTGMLRALVDADAQDAAIGLMVDPDAAAAANAAGAGERITLDLGGRSGIPGDAPFRGTFTVEALSDGHCHATGPYYGGAHLALGPSAALRIGGVLIALASEKAQMADRQMFRFLGIVPEDQKILVVKSSNHFRADFEPIAAAILTCAAPGPMPVSPAVLPFRHLSPGLRLEPGGPPFTPHAPD